MAERFCLQSGIEALHSGHSSALETLAKGTQMQGFPTERELLGMTDEELAQIDCILMNLIIAKGLPVLSHIEIGDYLQVVDDWGSDLARRLPLMEREFQDTPERWNNDPIFFRLGIVAWYADVVLGTGYREDHRERQAQTGRILYTEPDDVFITGVLNTRRGTCFSLALLYVALGRRIGLPVSLACAAAHFVCRYEQGFVIHNIESTVSGKGAFAAPPDEAFFEKKEIPRIAQLCGSDLCPLTPRQMLGVFFGMRARHLENINNFPAAEPDYLLARYLFPNNRHLYVSQNQISVQCSTELFEPGEKGHPIELRRWLDEVVRLEPWKRKATLKPKYKESLNDSNVDDFFAGM